MVQVEHATFGGGCFWCTEASYQLIRGVEAVTPGYAGGTEDDPTYERVVRGETSHAEVTRVAFDPQEVSYSDLLTVFWAIHDPTTPNRQGNDVGPQYRSIILYESEAQRAAASASLIETQKLWDRPIVTEIKPLEHFYPAESEHVDYFRRHPSQAYCQIIINPKLEKLRSAYQSLLART